MCLRHIASGRYVVVCTTHANVPLGGEDDTGVQAQATHKALLDCLVATRLLEANVAAVASATGAPAASVSVVCTGDFNSAPTSQVHKVQ